MSANRWAGLQWAPKEVGSPFTVMKVWPVFITFMLDVDSRTRSYTRYYVPYINSDSLRHRPVASLRRPVCGGRPEARPKMPRCPDDRGA
jgi:hypothetical protein